MSGVGYHPALVQAFWEYFAAGHGFTSIRDARAFAASVLGESVSPATWLAKVVDESVEAAIVHVARGIIEDAASSDQAFQQLARLYGRQPALTVRSSTSVLQQAYSTPVPIAYLAATLGLIGPNQTVYEPTAGHGALLLRANPALVTANELNPSRAAALRDQGFTVTEYDASAYAPEILHDVVILNPPFGTVPDATEASKAFQFGAFRTTQIDHAIALKSLRAMKPDGRAVLILGGKLGADEEKRSDRYNSRESRGFYYTLYRHYNVVQHLSIWGELYRRQGAGFPIDVIVIDGRGESSLPLPAAQVPVIYRSFEVLGELLHAFILQHPKRVVTPRRREDSGRPGSTGREGSVERTLHGVADASAGLDDPDVDTAAERDTGQHPGDDAIGVEVNGRRSDPASSAPRQRRDDMAGSVVPDIGAGSSFRTKSPNPASDNVPRHDRAQPGTANLAAGDVRSGGHTTQPGRMAGGTAVAVDRPRQVPYVQHSTGQPVGTLVPVNMQTAISKALERLRQQVGDIDAYVTDRLAYGTVAELQKHFSAEQIDACAQAIHNIERGSGFVLGDQTGIGKGRVVAAMIRYAKLTGRIPIFITKDTPLYADIVRDLRDIGLSGFKPFVTNENLMLPLPDGRTLQTDSRVHREVMASMCDSGQLQGFDAIFSTYHQIQTVKGKETDRRHFLRRFAQGSILILDESHEAGGSVGERHKAQSAPNRADFARALVGIAAGVLYSSATYAKTPDVMDLYSRTDMSLAVSSTGLLTSMVASGGVPLQQALATMLTEAGQYCRRERSFEGVRFDPVTIPVRRDIAENISCIMAQIMEFDRLKQATVKAIDKDMKLQAKAILGDNATGAAGASSTNFTSIMHNLIDQMLFALKAEAAVQKVLELLRQEEKPVIALSNTMGSFIQSYAEVQGLKVGDAISVDFGDLLRRYLVRSRDVLVGNPYGEKSRHYLTDAELGPAGVARYQTVLDLIADADFSGIPVSPVDYIIFRLQQEGYRVGEVTGREHTTAYQADGSLVYHCRSAKDRSKATAVETVKAFNDGRLDAIILNRSGSTGISLHASATFADQRRRHMIIAQAERDINQFMQMLGRIHRTGQVITPSFTLLMADIPAEKRPGAVLAKKMASLNANTTAARSNGIALENISDFMNEYGDLVIAEIMGSNLILHERLDFPLHGIDGSLESEDATRKVTGRIPLLSLMEQESLYDLIEQRYAEFVARQEAMGESILEARTLDLDARTLARMEVLPAEAGTFSPFTAPVFLEIVDAKTPRKPFTTIQVINTVRQNLALPSVEAPTQHDQESVADHASKSAAQAIEQLKADVVAHQARSAGKTDALFSQFQHVQSVLQQFPVGQSVRLVTERGDVFFGVVARVWQPGAFSGSPAAPSTWEIQFLLADPVQEISFPLSRVNTGKEKSIEVTIQEHDADGNDIYHSFDLRQTRNRENRQVFTGNLLRAYEKFPGRIINFTDSQGRIRQGLLTNRGFDIETELQRQPVVMPTIEDAWRFLLEETARTGQLKTSDGLLAIRCGANGTMVLITNKAKDSGGRFYLDDALLEATGAEFYSVSDRMECSFPEARLEEVLAVLMRVRNLSLAAFEQRERARDMLGVRLPSFLEVPEELPAEPVQAEQMTLIPLLELVRTPPPAPAIATGSASQKPASIAPRRVQMGSAEKNVAKLLEQAGLAEAVLQEEDFYIRIENDPYIPLVIERHSDRLFLTHYLTENWDTYIDSEMVFGIDGSGKLTLLETAVHSIGGEYRSRDRSFAGMFARNLLEQGFADAARQQRATTVQPPGVTPLTGVGTEAEKTEEFIQPTLLDMSQFTAEAQKAAVPEHDPAWKQWQTQEERGPPPLPSLSEVWEWARAARDLNLPRHQQNQIRMLGFALKNGQHPSISTQTLGDMQRDLDQYRPYQECGRKIQAITHTILSQVGHRDDKGRVTFGGKIYELSQVNDTLTIRKREGRKVSMILQSEGETVQRTTVDSEDLLRFEKLAERLRSSI